MTARLPVAFILATVLIDAMGVGLILPVMPELIREVRGADLGQAAVWGGLLATAFAVMQFIAGPTLGSLSDRFGRRPVLLVSLTALALDYLVMAVAGTIWLLLAGRIVGGVTAATHSTAMAFMADVSKPEDKAANFGLIGAAFGLGFVVGPLLGGVLGAWGTRAPFYAAALLAAANAAFGWFVMPETVTDRTRRPFLWRRANPLGAFRHIGALPGLKPLLLLSFVYSVAFFVYPAIWAYYGQARFGWGPGMVGLSLGLYGVMVAVVQGLLMRPILRRIGEARAVMLGLWIEVAAFLVLALTGDGRVALAFTFLAAFGSISGPALQGIMSRSAADDQQGELQGTLTAINAVAIIVAPLMMTQIFWYFTTGPAPFALPGAPFLLSALLTVICVWLFARARPGIALESQSRPASRT